MTEHPDHLVVVGASLAGLRAVEAARKDGYTGSITLIGAETHLPYDRPPLSKAFLDAGIEPVQAGFRTEHVLGHEWGVRLLLGQPATGLDITRRVVLVGDVEVPYDALVIATGALPRRLPGTGELAGVHDLRTVDDALAVRAALDHGARTVVIGAGFIGLEVATAARRRALPFTVVEALPAPLERVVGPVMGASLTALHERRGTSVLCGRRVTAIEGSDTVERVVLDDGTVLQADLVVVGIGVVPAVGWLAGSGVPVDNGVVCDETLWTGIPGVYAAGDVASWPNSVMGERQRTENWTAAAEQGAAAVRNALDPSRTKSYTTVPYCWSDWDDVRIQFVGSPRADEIRVVDGDPATGDRWVALYRRDDRLIGALTVNARSETMKYRQLIHRGDGWKSALTFAAQRLERTARPAPNVVSGRH